MPERPQELTPSPRGQFQDLHHGGAVLIEQAGCAIHIHAKGVGRCFEVGLGDV
jgi:hypothetical protein